MVRRGRDKVETESRPSRDRGRDEVTSRDRGRDEVETRSCTGRGGAEDQYRGCTLPGYTPAHAVPASSCTPAPRTAVQETGPPAMRGSVVRTRPRPLASDLRSLYIYYSDSSRNGRREHPDIQPREPPAMGRGCPWLGVKEVPTRPPAIRSRSTEYI